MAKTANTTGQQGFEAVVEQITYTGVKRQYRLRLRSGFLIGCVQINQGSEDDFAMNEQVFVHWQPQAARLLGA